LFILTLSRVKEKAVVAWVSDDRLVGISRLNSFIFGIKPFDLNEFTGSLA
jgi:hypothetical protein